MLLAYGLKIGNVVLQLFNFSVSSFGISGEAFGWPDVRKSGSWESVDQFGIHVDIVGCVECEHAAAIKVSPVSTRGWRRIRWLKRREIL